MPHSTEKQKSKLTGDDDEWLSPPSVSDASTKDEAIDLQEIIGKRENADSDEPVSHSQPKIALLLVLAWVISGFIPFVLWKNPNLTVYFVTFISLTIASIVIGAVIAVLSDLVRGNIPHHRLNTVSYWKSVAVVGKAVFMLGMIFLDSRRRRRWW